MSGRESFENPFLVLRDRRNCPAWARGLSTTRAGPRQGFECALRTCSRSSQRYYATGVSTSTALVVGIDAGATKTVAVVADENGARLGGGRAAGANLVSRGIAKTIESLDKATADALRSVDPRRVSHLVLAIAGANAAGYDDVRSRVGGLWRSIGLSCAWTLRSDIEATFAAGSSHPDGMVLVAGTGAVAGRIKENRLTRTVDGHGWLVGDEGSGFWLGREGVRAALDALDGRGHATRLTEALAEALHTVPERSEIVRCVYRSQPVDLSELSPAVCHIAAEGDQVASEIVRRGATALLDAVGTLMKGERQPTGPLVVGGGLLTHPGPMADVVTGGLSSRYGLTRRIARHGAAGAAVLALRDALGQPVPSSVHARLMAEEAEGAK